MRTFICIELSKEAVNEICRVMDRVKESELMRGKFVEPENLHLTLKFLGEVDDEKIKLVKEKLKKLKFKKFKVKLGRVGVFSPQFIRILWIDLESEELRKLQEEIDTLLSDLFEREKRFSNHVTLARVKSVKDKFVFLDFIQKEKVKEIEFEVKSVKFKKSTLTQEKPIYEDLIEVKLK